MTSFLGYELDTIERSVWDDINLPDEYPEIWTMIKNKHFDEELILTSEFVGVTILFIAMIRKFEFIKTITEYHNIKLSDILEFNINNIIKSAVEFLHTNHEEILKYTDNSINSIIKRLKLLIKIKEVFEESHDLYQLCCFLDMTQLFIEGCRSFIGRDYHPIIDPYRIILKDYIINELKDYYIAIYKEDLIKAFLVEDIYKPWLPMTFWWRHLPYLFYLAQIKKEI